MQLTACNPSFWGPRLKRLYHVGQRAKKKLGHAFEDFPRSEGKESALWRSGETAFQTEGGARACLPDRKEAKDSKANTKGGEKRGREDQSDVGAVGKH